MKNWITSIVLALIVSGCAATPGTVAECSDRFSEAIEIDACEERVARVEDRRTKLAEEKANCRFPRIWESTFGGHTGKCVQNSIHLY
jgi:hypothetical protein